MVELEQLGGKGPADATGAGEAFTLKQVTDVTDMAAQMGFEDMGEARFLNSDLGTVQTGVSHHRLKPGMRQRFGHRHFGAEEVYLVISGSGRVKLDDEVVELRELDALRVCPQVMRNFEAGDEGLELVAFGPRHDGDGEMAPGWWSD